MDADDPLRRSPAHQRCDERADIAALEPYRLSYTWESGEKHTVTWTLKDLGNGFVNLHLEQTGISNQQALHGAKYGWGKWCGELKKWLEQ